MCAPSNAAIDELLRRLTRAQGGILGSNGKNRPVKIIRLGRLVESTESCNETLSQYTIEYQVDLIIQNSGFVEELAKVNNRLSEAYSKLHTLRNQLSPDTDKLNVRIKKLYSDIKFLKSERVAFETNIETLRVNASRKIILESELIVSTLSSSSSSLFLENICAQDVSLDTVVIDEACQATEPASLIPLRYGCKKLILVGDPRQLH